MTLNQTFRGQTDLVTTGSDGDLKFIGVTTPGSDIEVIGYDIPVGKNLLLLQIHASCRMETKIVSYDDGDEIASGRTGAGNLNYNYQWIPYKIIDEGRHFSVNCFSLSGKPASDIEIFIQARLINKP